MKLTKVEVVEPEGTKLMYFFGQADEAAAYCDELFAGNNRLVISTREVLVPSLKQDLINWLKREDYDAQVPNRANKNINEQGLEVRVTSDAGVNVATRDGRRIVDDGQPGGSKPISGAKTIRTDSAGHLVADDGPKKENTDETAKNRSRKS